MRESRRSASEDGTVDSASRRAVCFRDGGLIDGAAPTALVRAAVALNLSRGRRP